MSLRIRRGTDAQRQTVTFDQGELVYTTDTLKLFVGDGVTAGGNNIGKALAGTGLVFDTITQTLQATATGSGGIASVSADTNPALGGNLNISGHNIVGTGNIATTGTIFSTVGLGGNLILNGNNVSGTGNIAITGTLSVTGLGADLVLNSHNITGVGNINQTGTISTSGLATFGSISTTGTLNVTGATGLTTLTSTGITNTGNITTTGTISATTGLGANLSLNGYNITGSTGAINITGNITSGNISTAGTITATTGLGANLPLNGYNITGSTGAISISGAITTTGSLTGGTITATSGLGADLALSGHNITGNGGINITGNINNNGTITTTGNFTQSSGSLTYTGSIPNYTYVNGSINYPCLNVGQINLLPANAFNGLGGLSMSTQGDTNNDPFALFVINNANNVPTANQAYFSRSRGTLASPTTVQTGDGIFALTWTAQASSSSVYTAEILVNASGTITSSAVPGQMALQVANSSGTMTSGLTIDGPTRTTTLNNYLVVNINNSITAAGSNQAGATPLSNTANIVTSVASSTGVSLPTGISGMVIWVYNAGTNPLLIYPVNAGSAKINALATNSAFSLSVGSGIKFLAASSTQWYTL